MRSLTLVFLAMAATAWLIDGNGPATQLIAVAALATSIADICLGPPAAGEPAQRYPEPEPGQPARTDDAAQATVIELAYEPSRPGAVELELLVRMEDASGVLPVWYGADAAILERYRFALRARGEHWRAYIVQQPEYRGMPADGHSTHRYYDPNSALYYVCYEPMPRTSAAARAIARQWASRTSRYIHTGTRF